MNRVRQIRVPGLVSLLLVVILLMTSVAQAAPPTPSDGGVRTVQRWTATVDLGDEADMIAGRADKQSKLDASLAEVANAAQRSSADALVAADAQRLPTSGDTVQVYVTVGSGQLAGATGAIRSAGGRVTKTAEKTALVQAWIPASKLEQVAADPRVVTVSRPNTGVPDEGTLTTEGLAASDADDWHAAGYRGAGAKIAVVDAGFIGYNDLLGTDLPSNVIVKNFVDGETDSQANTTTQHGTACAEIAYDMAPAAQLYLVKVNTSLDLQEAVAWLAAQGVDVISMSLSWLNEGPGDGTGLVPNLVTEARSKGIAWFTSAGNYRQRHWGGNYSSPDGDKWHNFSGTDEANFLGPGDQTNVYLIPYGRSINAFLRWNDWANVNQDFDLYLYRCNPTTGACAAVAASTLRQTGAAGQKPMEEILYTTTVADQAYFFAVYAYSTTPGRATNLEIITTSYNINYQVAARSITSPSDSPYSVSVGAVDVGTHQQEAYSSEGPSNGPGGVATGGLIKPDIASYANVSTVTYGTTNKFNGTSAATPHAAGAAALVAGAAPSYTPDQITSFLTGRAVHLGAAGKNNQYGYGRLSLGAPPIQVCGNISADATWTTGTIYVATCNVVVQPGVTLTIQPGVVVSFRGQYGLEVQGTLSAVGTSDKRIVFTSSASSQAAGSWNGIVFASTSTNSHLSFAEVRYAGYDPTQQGNKAGVVVNGSSPTIDNTVFADNGTNHVYVDASGNPVLSNGNAFLCNSTSYSSVYGVNNASTASPPTIGATADYWGDPSGPYNATTNPNGRGCQVSANVDYANWIGGTSQVTFLPKPERAVDTRPDSGYQGANQPLQGINSFGRFAMAGRGGVPANATAVLVNLTAVGYRADGWLAAYPACAATPNTSSVNFDTQENAIANFAIVKLGVGPAGSVCNGAIDVKASGYTNVIVDVAGYLVATPYDQVAFLATPQRVVDTRSGQPYQGSGKALQGTDSFGRFTLAGQVGIPSNATAVLVNLTAVGYPTDGWLAAWPACAASPATSSVNFDTVENAIANFAIVKLGTGPDGSPCQGAIDVKGFKGANVIVDVAGYLVATPYDQIAFLDTPQRIVDTRAGSGYVGAGLPASTSAHSYAVAGQRGVPAQAKGVIANLTAAGYTRDGWIAAYPTGEAVPPTSSVNYDTDENAIANSVIVRVGTGGQVNLVASSQTNAIIDVTAYLR